MSIHDDIAKAAARARQSDSLQPIGTRIERLREGGINWIVRVVERLSDKPVGLASDTCEGDVASTGERRSVWLPPEPELLVTELGGTHVIVLNKFPVIDNHALIVTRRFEDQMAPLSLADFEALQAAMSDWPGAGALGFYNGGRVAGASQDHKHVQLVPLPLADGDATALPIDPLHTLLPFSASVAALDGSATAQQLVTVYHQLRDEPGIKAQTPYNLLVTRDWMMIVPRSREHYQGISVNSLGFAGCLLARNEDDLEIVRRAGPATILSEVTSP